MMIAPGASPADIAALRAHYGLDVPLWQQFWVWLKAVLHGRFRHLDLDEAERARTAGRAAAGHAGTRHRRRLPGAVVVGGASPSPARWCGARSANRSSTLSTASCWPCRISSGRWPSCWCSACWFRCLPMSGRSDPALDAGLRHAVLPAREPAHAAGSPSSGDVLQHMMMPALALGPAARRRHRPRAQERADGRDGAGLHPARPASRACRDLRLLLQEALRNAVGPTLALTGVQFTFLIGGTVIIERIFAYPGIGNLAIDAVINRDLPLIQGLVLMFGVIFILVNMVVDLTVAALNPRLRHA